MCLYIHICIYIYRQTELIVIAWRSPPSSLQLAIACWTPTGIQGSLQLYEVLGAAGSFRELSHLWPHRRMEGPKCQRWNMVHYILWKHDKTRRNDLNESRWQPEITTTPFQFLAPAFQGRRKNPPLSCALKPSQKIGGAQYKFDQTLPCNYLPSLRNTYMGACLSKLAAKTPYYQQLNCPVGADHSTIWQHQEGNPGTTDTSVVDVRASKCPAAGPAFKVKLRCWHPSTWHAQFWVGNSANICAIENIHDPCASSWQQWSSRCLCLVYKTFQQQVPTAVWTDKF